MFKLSIEKQYLKDSISFLYNMSLKGTQSRHRSKLVRILQKSLEELSVDETNLIKDYATEFTEDGEPKANPDGTFKVRNVKEFKAEQKILLQESVVITGEEHNTMLQVVRDIVEEYDEQISGSMAVVHGYLCESITEIKEEK